jgi:hypothetical protein
MSGKSSNNWIDQVNSGLFMFGQGRTGYVRLGQLR